MAAHELDDAEELEAALLDLDFSLGDPGAE